MTSRTSEWNILLMEKRTSELPNPWKGRLFSVKYVDDRRSPMTMSILLSRTSAAMAGPASAGYVSSPSTMM